MSSARCTSGSLLVTLLVGGCGGEPTPPTATPPDPIVNTDAPDDGSKERDDPPAQPTPPPSQADHADHTATHDAATGPPKEQDSHQDDVAPPASPPAEPPSTPSPAAAADTPAPDDEPLVESGPESEPEPEPSAPEPAPPVRAPVTYILSPSQSWLAVLVWNDPNTVGSAAGHDHAIVASTFTGHVRWSPDEASACSVEISVPVSGLRADPDGARERAKLSADGAVSEKSERTIEKNLRSDDQLWASKHTTIRFESTTCTATDSGVSVTGDLTIRGVTKTVSAPMTISFPDDDLRARGRLEISHSMFGFEPFSAAFGALRNQDRLSLRVDVRGSAQ